MATLEIANTTPLQLQLRRYYRATEVPIEVAASNGQSPNGSSGVWTNSEVLAELGPLGDPVVLERSDHETLWLSANAGRSPIASFAVDPSVPRRVVTAADIGYPAMIQLTADANPFEFAKGVLEGRKRGSLSADPNVPGFVAIPTDYAFALGLLLVRSATFTNSTGVYVELSCIVPGAQPVERPAGITIAPGGSHTVGRAHSPLRYVNRDPEPEVPVRVGTEIGSAWLARASFSGELLAMFVLTPDVHQTFTITDTFAKRVAERFPMPSPLPPIQNVALVGDTRQRPRHRDHIAIADREYRRRPTFNTRKDIITRSVRISGVELVWDPVRDTEYGLLSFSGDSVLDLEVLELYADRVVIAAPLRFPGTSVSIHARELVFQGDGCIDTTPIGFTTQARAKYHLADGVTPADEQGEPTYEPADGEDGQAGGDIGLFVGTLTLPTGGETLQRFIARGAAGHTAEKGNKRPYAPKPGDSSRPKAEDGKTRAAVTTDAINNRVRDAMPIAKSASDWRWPGGADGPGSVTWQGQRLFPEAGGHVIDLQLVLHDDTVYIKDTNWLCFTSGSRDTRGHWVANGPQQTPDGSYALFGGYEEAPSWKALLPGNGEDAYAGGKPGDGGSGGTIRTSLSLELVAPLCVTAGGSPGQPTAAVPGGDPGGPVPAYKVILDVVKKTPPWESDRSPQVSVWDVSAQPGAPGEARYGNPGETTTPQAVDQSWLQPEVAEAALAFARDAYRNGHRDLARRVIEPYYAALHSQPAPPDLEPALVSIHAMRATMLDNLDYYGNPPGWVPRLRLSTNLDIFQEARKIAAKPLYYGQAAEQKYADLDQADELAREAAVALVGELDFSTLRLKDAYTDLASAYVELQDAREKLMTTQVNANFLKAMAEGSALDIAERQRLFRGITKLVGGTLQALPVGQPYLGLAGSGLTTTADINFTDPNNIPKEIGKALGKFGATTDTFLKDNADLLVDDRVKGLRDKLRLDKSKVENLEDQLTKTKGANDNLARQMKQKSDKWEQAWKSQRTGQLEALEATRTNTQKRIDAVTALTTPLTDEQQQLLKTDQEIVKLLPANYRPRTLLDQQRTLDWQIARLKEAIAEDEAVAKTVLGSQRKKELEADTTKLEASKTLMAALETDKAAAEKVLARGSDALERQKTEWGRTFTRLQGMGKGLSAIGEGIATLGTPLSKDDPDVQALAKTMLASPQQEAYHTLVGQLDELGKTNRMALARCTDAQNQINREVACISQNLSAQNALSHTRQSIEGALDVQTIRYLRAMQERARDMLRWSLYNLVMAWRYEFLRDVSNDLYNMDKVVAELRKLETVSPDGKLHALTEADLQKVEQTVVDDLLWDEWKKIVAERQRHALVRQDNDFVCHLTPDQLEQLRRTGQLRFNLVRDFKSGNFNWVDARIQDFKLEDFDLESNQPNLNLRIVFRHSGESIVLGSDKKTYYYFQTGKDDDPIEWGFGYSHHAKWVVRQARKKWLPERWKELVAKDKPDPELNELLNKVVKPTTEEKVVYHEYLPSYFSDITLRLSREQTWDPATITRLSRVVFRVSYALTTERVS
jgi:hypothetical protein